jgi:hypothetical protein
MNWQDCIKNLNGYKVITHKGDKADIVKFDTNDDLYGKPINKYKVKFLNSIGVGWYTYDQLTLCNNGYRYVTN